MHPLEDEAQEEKETEDETVHAADLAEHAEHAPRAGDDKVVGKLFQRDSQLAILAIRVAIIEQIRRVRLVRFNCGRTVVVWQEQRRRVSHLVAAHDNADKDCLAL
eukprot:CAMPEP_0181220726 /NCGR_PEP_ID=MMETSP1096-20121128/28994_1 /TAXON_ID=156174 ORGANISM="Chrysochromulina ericina, Strain CCMP281" /NCGR_SAMPLE_ID=MMETSP1096 /ASSEMBLY_ACC=CAM_ASM_000453 /LENGTH=104 /DNA_ID=CAMNT_0023313255 /DNA_START=289 /DNA_END=603 /DNA_ORIENTATION=-